MSRSMRMSLWALFIALITAQGADARQVPPLQGLETLRKSFSGVTDFTADIVQEKQISLMKKKLVSTGTVRFRKPALFFMELNPPYASRLVLNDTVLKLFFPREKRTSQIVLPPDQSLRHWFAYLANPVKALPDGVDVKADQQGDLLSVAISPRSSGQVREFTVTLQTDGIIRKLVIVERSGDRTIITFNRVRRNTGLTEKDFRIN